MANNFRVILVIFSLCLEFSVCLRITRGRKGQISLPLPLPRSGTPLSNLVGEPIGVNSFDQQFNLMHSLPSRSDNRNSILESPLFRSKPKCNKRIRIANGITRFRERGAFVRFSCSDSFTLLGTTIAVCLRDEWSDIPPICVRPGCRRLLTPNNGQARLTYSGAVADFLCQVDYKLEGSRVIYCDGNRWNDTEPACVPIHPVPSSTEVWEWPQPPTTEEIETGNGDELSPTNKQESWDFNSASPDPIDSTSTEISNNLTSSQDNTLIPLPSHSTTDKPPTYVPITHTASEESPFLDRTASSTKLMDIDAIATTRELTYESTTENVSLSSVIIHREDETSPTEQPLFHTSSTISSTTIKSLVIPEIVKTTTRSTIVVPTSTTTKIMLDPTTTENWEPFPNNAFDKFDQELEAGESITYETKSASAPLPEFIVPISPHKLGDDEDHAFYKKWGHISIMGGIVLGALGGISLVGGMVTYCWRKKVGIARAGEHDQDGRTLSASDANDDFMWMDASRDHRMSRL